MKVTKILTDILKITGNSKKSVICSYGADREYVYWTPDGHRMYKIPQEDFLIDLGKAFPDKIPLNNPNKMFDDSNTESAVKSNLIRVIGKENLVKIVSEKSHAWVNVDYLKEFEPDCHFRIIKPNAPVFVYEDEKLVAIVLPVRVAGEEG